MTTQLAVIAVTNPLDSTTIRLSFVEDHADLTWRDMLVRWEFR